MRDGEGPVGGFSIRVYYEDTDAGGVVYHANYLRFAERARTEWLRAIGVDHQTLLDEHDLRVVVRRCVVAFHKPARLDDRLVVETRLRDLGAARAALEQTILRDRDLLVTVEVELVFINSSSRPTRIPSGLRRRLAV